MTHLERLGVGLIQGSNKGHIPGPPTGKNSKNTRPREYHSAWAHCIEILRHPSEFISRPLFALILQAKQ